MLSIVHTFLLLFVLLPHAMSDDVTTEFKWPEGSNDDEKQFVVDVQTLAGERAVDINSVYLFKLSVYSLCGQRLCTRCMSVS